MSHPPETSLSSRELAIRLIQMPVDAVDRGEQLIDAWVREREQETFHFIANHCDEEGFIHRVEILELATARKQLEEKVK